MIKNISLNHVMRVFPFKRHSMPEISVFISLGAGKLLFITYSLCLEVSDNFGLSYAIL
jgi:hypothetical protein